MILRSFLIASFVLLARSPVFAEGAPAAYRGKILEMTGLRQRPVNVWDYNGQAVFEPYYTFDKKGVALVDRDYALRLEGGCFVSGGLDDTLGDDFAHTSGELSICAYVQPALSSAEKTGCILSYGPRGGDPIFALRQEKDALVFAIAEGEMLTCALPNRDPFHVVITVSAGESVCCLNGKKTGSAKGTERDFSAWQKGLLFLGMDPKCAQSWRGRLERVTLFNHALSAKAAEETSEAVLALVAKRAPVPRITFRGTLLAQSTNDKDWEGYRDVLMVNEYRVDRVVSGEYASDKIRVAEWMFIDKIFLVNSAKSIGSAYELTVEDLNANPQFAKNERADTLELDLDATVYLDVGALESLPQDQQPGKGKEK